MKQVHFIRTEDWIRMYIDGVLADEGHSLHVVWAAEKLAVIGPFLVTSEYIDDAEEFYARCDEYVKEWATP